MPRKPRFFIPGVPVHIVQRGRSRAPVFFEEADYMAYLRWLGIAAERYKCKIHAYVLMTNHIHILATPADMEGVTRMMQNLGRHYVPYINFTYGTTGSIWEGRYKASLVQEGDYLLTCMRYIELNPVMADMARSPVDYRWSSYHFNAQGEADSLITPHSLYESLGGDKLTRGSVYKELFGAYLDKGVRDSIRAAWKTGTPLGNDYFREAIESKLGCKVGQARRGRPGKKK